DPTSRVAIHHVRIEPTRSPRFERSDPRDRLTAELIDEGIVLDREWDVLSRFREHDAPPAAHPQEGLSVEPALPDLVHHPAPDRGDPVGAGEAEPALNLRVETVKVGSEHLLINRIHAFSGPARRRQRAADGMLPTTRRSMLARQATARFSVNGLNAALRYRGEFIPTAAVARSINARQTNSGQRRCQATSSATANDSSRMPRAVTTGPATPAARPASRTMAISLTFRVSSLGMSP